MATPHDSTSEMTDTLKMAALMKKDQGYHETEVSFGGETDLQKSAIMCMKNPNHTNFIPVREFNIEHLPPEYRNSDIVDFIKAWADVTCRVSVNKISENRPEFFTGTDRRFPFYQDRGKSDVLMTGTGWVSVVWKYTEKNNINCVCAECVELDPDTRKKEWGEVSIHTAAHVVCDNIEAAHTSCEFFYDDGNTDVSKVPKLTGGKVYDCDIKGDYCKIKFTTHDVELVEKLYKMHECCLDLQDLLYNTYNRNNGEMFTSRDSYFLNRLSVCVSHPHGCAKQITIGQVTHRQTIHSERNVFGGVKEFTQYTYNTPTCPGSSGARVFIPECGERKVMSMSHGLRHIHSGGHSGNINMSAVMEEYSSFPPVYVQVNKQPAV